MLASRGFPAAGGGTWPVEPWSPVRCTSDSLAPDPVSVPNSTS